MPCRFMRVFRRRNTPKISYAGPPLPVEPAYAIIATLCILAVVLMRNHVTPFHIVSLILAAIGNGILAFRPKL